MSEIELRMYNGLHVNYHLFLPDFSDSFQNRFSKNPQIPNFMKILPVGAEMFHADGRTYIMKTIFPFRNFANAPLNPNNAHIYY
jgi:hypothetical protein